jgi:hypothetical protein
MNTKYFVIVLVITAIISLFVIAKQDAYSTSQSVSQANVCGNQQLPDNTGCQNIDSSILGDSNAATVVGQQRFPLSPPAPTTATLIVIVQAQCVQGQQCPNLPVYTGVPDFISGTHIFLFDAIDPIPQNFWGSEEGTPVTLVPGSYGLGGSIFTPPGLEFVGVTQSPECDDATSGPIEAGDERTCTWTNTFRPAPSG